MLTPVEVVRRVLPAHRLPFHVGVGAPAAVGVSEWPPVLAAGLGREAPRRPTS